MRSDPSLVADRAVELAREGFFLARDLTSPGLSSVLADAFERLGIRSNHRNLLRGVPAVRTLLAEPAVQAAVTATLGPGAAAVRGIFFDKNPDSNWAVPWHQDLSIALDGRPERPPPGYGPWSTKAGVVHAEPPAELLADMLTLRLHLDDCDETNGALRVLPGTHRHGRVDDCAALAAGPGHVVAAGAGDGLFMRPLLLHASSKATQPRRRRIVHLEFSAGTLPDGLRWAEHVPL